MLRKIMNYILPYFEMKHANKMITKKADVLKENLAKEDNYLSTYMKEFEGIPVKEAKQIFNSIISNRKSLEEKAKINVLIVTIAVTAILGLLTFLFTNQEKMPDNIIFIVFLVLLFVMGLFYLISGSIISLAALNSGESKEIYNMSPLDYQYIANITNLEEKERERRYFYSQYADLNTKVNLKINNYISCTYANIRNALIVLGILVVVFCFVFILDSNEEQVNLESELNKQTQLLEQIILNQYLIRNETKRMKEMNIKYDNERQEKILYEIKILHKAIKESQSQLEQEFNLIKS